VRKLFLLLFFSGTAMQALALVPLHISSVLDNWMCTENKSDGGFWSSAFRFHFGVYNALCWTGLPHERSTGVLQQRGLYCCQPMQGWQVVYWIAERVEGRINPEP
jgi:hypothetical protein